MKPLLVITRMLSRPAHPLYLKQLNSRLNEYCDVHVAVHGPEKMSREESRALEGWRVLRTKDRMNLSECSNWAFDELEAGHKAFGTLDDDAYVSPRDLVRVETAFDTIKKLGYYGPMGPVAYRNKVKKSIHIDTVLKKKQHPFGVWGLKFFSAKLYKKVGGLDERLNRAQDVDMAITADRLGYQRALGFFQIEHERHLSHHTKENIDTLVKVLHKKHGKEYRSIINSVEKYSRGLCEK